MIKWRVIHSIYGVRHLKEIEIGSDPSYIKTRVLNQVIGLSTEDHRTCRSSSVGISLLS